LTRPPPPMVRVLWLFRVSKPRYAPPPTGMGPWWSRGPGWKRRPPAPGAALIGPGGVLVRVRPELTWMVSFGLALPAWKSISPLLVNGATKSTLDVPKPGRRMTEVAVVVSDVWMAALPAPTTSVPWLAIGARMFVPPW